MARRKNVKRIDPRYFLHETVNRGEEEKEPGVGGQPPEWERKLAKSDPSGPTARSKRRHVRGLEDPDVDVEELEEEQGIFAPNHYCVHHGGVQHEGQIKMAEAINHNFNRKLNRVTHYDMRLQNGTILEGVAAEDIQVVRASLAEEHSHEGGCASEEGGEAIDISAPGTEVHVDDISQLSPEEAFAAGMAAAREAIDQAMGGPDGPPPEGTEE
tara:strand:- start:402 stop:1040 length:639 start_codon:yes stop_codon:yes gene_type:complete